MFYIITVVWNDVKGLKSTFESISNQHYKNLCWVVIDGGSTDGSLVWLESLDYEKFIFLSEPDDGIYDAMNKGISCIDVGQQGWFTFLNAGDEFVDRDVLKDVVRLAPDDSSLVYGDYIDVDGDIHYPKLAKPLEHLKYGMLTSHQATFFAIKYASKFSHDLKYKLSGDYDFICRVVQDSIINDIKISKIDRTICYFYLDGISVSNRIEALKEDCIIRKEVLKLNRISVLLFFVMHYVHYKLKKIMPKFFVSKRL